VFDQMREHGEGLGPEPNLLRTPPQLRVPGIETKPAKRKQVAVMHYQKITAS
jgi:hypothetical protein